MHIQLRQSGFLLRNIKIKGSVQLFIEKKPKPKQVALTAIKYLNGLMMRF